MGASWGVELCGMLAAGPRVFKNCRTYCVSEDAKRLGCPKLDVTVYELYCAGVERGMYLPPQDFLGWGAVRLLLVNECATIL